MKKILLIIFVIMSVINVQAQRLLSRTGHIWIYSKTPLEEIEADNREVASILNTSDGSLQISMLIKSFQFKRTLMQEHFNEEYMESDKLPKSTFVGKITNISEVNFKKDGEYPATAAGDLTIHGVTKKVTITGKVIVKGSTVSIKTKFEVVPQDYDITIPDLVAGKIAQQIDVNVDIPYQNK